MRVVWYVIVLMVLAARWAGGAEVVRPAAVAGQLYPENEKTLRETIAKYYEAVTVQPPSQRLMGCIVPHSGYGLCGKVMASAFKELQPGQYQRVIILAPSHYAQLFCCSIPSVHAFVTPLDLILLDIPVIERMCYSPYFELQALHRISRRPRPHVHEPEYSIEVLLPFLKERLGSFKLIPILVGDIRDSSGKRNEVLLDAVAETVRRAMDERTLLIASSDLTAYGAEFGYTPFQENVLDGVEKLDREAIALIERLDYKGFHEFLERTKDPICGRQAIDIFLRVMQPGTQARFLAYEQSGRLMKMESRSIGFAAINFYHPELPPLMPEPLPLPNPEPEQTISGAAPKPDNSEVPHPSDAASSEAHDPSASSKKPKGAPHEKDSR